MASRGGLHSPTITSPRALAEALETSASSLLLSAERRGQRPWRCLRSAGIGAAPLGRWLRPSRARRDVYHPAPVALGLRVPTALPSLPPLLHPSTREAASRCKSPLGARRSRVRGDTGGSACAEQSGLGIDLVRVQRGPTPPKGLGVRSMAPW